MCRSRSAVDPSATPRPLSGRFATMVSTALLVAVAATTHATDVRQPDTGPEYRPTFGRAYVRCTAPNTTARDGTPACTPALTSACDPRAVVRDAAGRTEFEPLVHLRIDTFLTSGPSACRTEPYSIDVATRTTFAGRLSGDLLCTSGACTLQDDVTSFVIEPASFERETALRAGVSRVQGVAVTGVTGVRPLIAAQVELKNARLRIKGATGTGRYRIICSSA